MIFTLSPIFENGKFVCDTQLLIKKNTKVYIYGKRIHLHHDTTPQQLCDIFGTFKAHYSSPPHIRLLEYIPRTITSFKPFNRKEFIRSFSIPPKYQYTSPNKHAILVIEGEPPFNPTPFQRLEKSKLPHFRGSCTFWCLWYIEYRELNREYDREFLEQYALFKLRKYASEYLSWWIANFLL